MTDDMIRYPY